MQNAIIQKKSFIDFHGIPFSSLSGFLEKKGSFHTAWKKRYFALSGGNLKSVKFICAFLIN